MSIEEKNILSKLNIYEHNDIEKLIYQLENELYNLKSEYMNRHHYLDSNEICQYEKKVEKLQTNIRYLRKSLENGIDYLSDLSAPIENKILSSM